MTTFNDVLVVGMHFRDREGVPASAICGSMLEGTVLDLEREPDNAYDPDAIKVLSNGNHIGYISRDTASFLSPEIDSGQTPVAKVTGFEAKGRNRHPVLQITLESPEE